MIQGMLIFSTFFIKKMDFFSGRGVAKKSNFFTPSLTKAKFGTVEWSLAK